MLTRLTQNVFSFSAAKNYQELRTITDALRDDDGNLVSFRDFKNQVQIINEKFNSTYLQTEYDTCIATATQAARWKSFEREKDMFPYLQYQTAGDERVRDSHAAMNGIVKRVDDPFWKTYYPPNGWNCRCEVIRLPDDEQQESSVDHLSSDTARQSVPELFRTNCGQTGMIFPKEHPYYDGVPNREIRKAIAYLPPENAYVQTYGNRRVPINQHVMHGIDELQSNMEVLNDLINLKEGIKEAKLLPAIHSKDNDLKSKFYPENWKFHNQNKNADAVLHFGKESEPWVVDFKRLTGNGKHLKGDLIKAAEQADYAIVKLSKENVVESNDIKRIVNIKMKETNLKGIMIIDNDGSLIYESFKNTTAG